MTLYDSKTKIIKIPIIVFFERDFYKFYVVILLKNTVKIVNQNKSISIDKYNETFEHQNHVNYLLKLERGPFVSSSRFRYKGTYQEIKQKGIYVPLPEFPVITTVIICNQ